MANDALAPRKAMAGGKEDEIGVGKGRIKGYVKGKKKATKEDNFEGNSAIWMEGKREKEIRAAWGTKSERRVVSILL